MSYDARLIAAAAPYWEAEAALSRRFFAGPPTREAWIRFLRAAVYKELNPVIGYGSTQGYANGLHMEFAQLIGRFAELDRGLDRRAFHAALKQMTEEFNHYLVLAEVLEFVLGRALTPEDPVQLPEDRKLNEMRRRYVASGDAPVRAAMMLTEGGGARLFAEAAKLSGGPIEERLAAAMAVITADEAHHVEDAAAAAAAVIGSEEDFARARAALVEVSLQRVRMRFEMCAEPMPWTEVERLVAGG